MSHLIRTNYIEIFFHVTMFSRYFVIRSTYKFSQQNMAKPRIAFLKRVALLDFVNPKVFLPSRMEDRIPAQLRVTFDLEIFPVYVIDSLSVSN